MAILPILTFPNPVLREKAAPVVSFNSDLEKLSADMLETMYDAPGVGLAANQVGVLLRIAVLDVDYKIEGDEEEDGIRKYVNQNPIIIVNPRIVESSGEILFKEGCLSVPGFHEEVKRAERVVLEYQDLKGKVHRVDGKDLLGVAIQHEMDHLDGRLYIDRLSTVKRSLIKGKLVKNLDESQKKALRRSRFKVEL